MTGDFSNVLLKRLEKISNVRTEKGFIRLWNNEIKLVKEREKENPALKSNIGYTQWKNKITRLYVYSAKLKGFKNVTKNKKL